MLTFAFANKYYAPLWPRRVPRPVNPPLVTGLTVLACEILTLTVMSLICHTKILIV